MQLSDLGSILVMLAGLAAGLTLAGCSTNALADDFAASVPRTLPIENDVSATDPISHASASAGGGFEIRWQTINGGATASTAGNYQLRGTVGQPDVDPVHPAQSTDFAHTGGFWLVLPGAGDVVRIVIFGDRFEG